MASERLFGKDDVTVHSDLEEAAGRFDEANVGSRITRADVGRQTGGPGFVVSNHAILDRDLHASVSKSESTVPKQ